MLGALSRFFDSMGTRQCKLIREGGPVFRIISSGNNIFDIRLIVESIDDRYRNQPIVEGDVDVSVDVVN